MRHRPQRKPRTPHKPQTPAKRPRISHPDERVGQQMSRPHRPQRQFGRTPNRPRKPKSRPSPNHTQDKTNKVQNQARPDKASARHRGADRGGIIGVAGRPDTRREGKLLNTIINKQPRHHNRRGNRVRTGKAVLRSDRDDGTPRCGFRKSVRASAARCGIARSQAHSAGENGSPAADRAVMEFRP